MFIVNLTYRVSVAEIEAHLDDHRRYLQKNLDRGVFIAAGRKNPPTGGIILMRAESRQEAEALARQDPFYRAGVAEYELVEFTATRTGKGFEKLSEG
ncbi:GTP cyclohydrolase [candidate division KSB1 bacterium]|nr:GTP cyclohydrolase [candidate division KSB1 bacterium]